MAGVVGGSMTSSFSKGWTQVQKLLLGLWKCCFCAHGSRFATSVNSGTSSKDFFLWWSVDIWQKKKLMLFTPPLLLPPLFFFCHFSLSLQTDIHASLHLSFNLPLSPKIFFAQAWDKGIITSKESWEGEDEDCPLPPSWKEKWTIR